MAGVLEQAQGNPNITDPKYANAEDGGLQFMKDSAAASKSPTGDHDLNRPQSPEEAFRSAQLAVQPGASAVTGKDQQATPEEQEEYERASQILSESLYSGEAADGISQMLTPDEKVGSVAKAAMFAITALDSQHDFDEVVIPQLAEETVERVIEIYEAQNGDEFTESESQAALGSAWEGLMEPYGVSANDYADLTQGLDKKGFEGFEQEYQGFLKGASQ